MKYFWLFIAWAIVKQFSNKKVKAELLGEFVAVTFEFLFAFYATEIVGFTVVSDFVFGGFFVQVYTAHGVSWHVGSFFSPLGKGIR